MYNRIVLSVCGIAIITLGGWILMTRPAPAPAEQGVDATTTLPYFDGSATPPSSPGGQPDANGQTSDTITLPANLQNIMNATLHTNKGDITIKFFPDRAPNTVANFIKLASAGFYDGTKFHRVIKGFMIQGGDPLTKDNSAEARWGTGGPGYTFKDELGPDNKNDVGTISMANSGPDTNGSQFFINAAANNFLDDKHTVFGKVTAGLDVVEAIDSVQTDSADRPVDPVVIQSISLN